MYEDNSSQSKAIGRTFSPLARFMALSGRNTLRTLRIFTTEMADDLQEKQAFALPKNKVHAFNYLILEFLPGF